MCSGNGTSSLEARTEGAEEPEEEMVPKVNFAKVFVDCLEGNTA